MWIHGDWGFLSVVEARTKDHEGELCVRARDRIDLRIFRARFCPDLSNPIQTPARDYRFRAWVTKEGFGRALAKAAEAIDYDNVKDAVKERIGPERAAILHRVWTDLYEIQSPGWSIQSSDDHWWSTLFDEDVGTY